MIGLRGASNAFKVEILTASILLSSTKGGRGRCDQAVRKLALKHQIFISRDFGRQRIRSSSHGCMLLSDLPFVGGDPRIQSR